jgi:hypothetical protein
MEIWQRSQREYPYGRNGISADITVEKGNNQRNTHTTTTMVMMRMMMKERWYSVWRLKPKMMETSFASMSRKHLKKIERNLNEEATRNTKPNTAKITMTLMLNGEIELFWTNPK